MGDVVTTPTLGARGQLISTASLLAQVAHVAKTTGDSTLREAHRHFQRARLASRTLGPASSLRAVTEMSVEPLARSLGYVIGGEPTVVTASALTLPARVEHTLVPWVVTHWGSRLDPLWRAAHAVARSAQCRWALICNGTHLRILDTSGARARRWIELDLDLAADDRDTFVALWIVGGADREHTRLATIVEASDALALGVCRSLRDGVLTASEEVLSSVMSRRLRQPMDQAVEQALTVVYRMLFLLFAESRGLVPMWHPVYRDGYSIDALRAAAERGLAAGMWDGLRAVSRLAHAGCRTSRLTVTPFNGRLFDTARAPFVERRDLDDEAASRAVLALTTRLSKVRGGRERIAYADLGVEQLGGVYETLLDYEPEWTGPARAGRIRLRPGSGARKASGSFYTPQPIARYLVARTLAPLVAGRTPDDILSLRVLDPSMGSGAFLVAACSFLADAYEDALAATGTCRSGDLDDGERGRIRRLIAERCLFGVDLNPMAVQLARLSLWLATLAHDRPLSFLDHHLRTGDSLLGAWLSSLTRPPAPISRSRHSDNPLLFDRDGFEEAARTLVPARFSLAGPSDTVEHVRNKEAALARLERRDSLLSRWRRVADIWCASWFSQADALPRAAYVALADAALHDHSALPQRQVERYLTHAADVARARRFFHWELEFPEVFFEPDGQRQARAGFDAIVGNPPWDMVRADLGNATVRSAARTESARVVTFVRDAGVYDAAVHGHLNRYQLFVERSLALLRPGGRGGLVVPGGLLNDHGSASVRRLLFSRCEVDGVVTFDNRRAIFPIHRSVRFALVTATKGTPTTTFGLRSGETDPAVLDHADSGQRSWFPMRMSCAILDRISGDDLAVPDVRQPIDLVIVERTAMQFPSLGSADGWHAHFGRELNATDDRDILRPPGRGLPIVAGKQIVPFRVNVEQATASVDDRDASRKLGNRIRRPRLAYRDVASATNRQTLIAAVLPAHCASTHTVFCLKSPLSLRAQHFLCGLFNSYVVNYLVRQRVTTHVTTSIVERLPVPVVAPGTSAFQSVSAIAWRLASPTQPRSASFERSRAASQQPEVAFELSVKLNAFVAALYQLTADEYAHVLQSFPLVPSTERSRCLEAYRGML